VKIGKDLQKYVKPVASNCGPWPQNMVVSLDRTLGEITRILDKQVDALQRRPDLGMGKVGSCPGASTTRDYYYYYYYFFFLTLGTKFLKVGN